MKRPIKRPFKECSQSQKKTGTCENWGAPPPPQLGTPVHEKIMIPQKKRRLCGIMAGKRGELFYQIP